MRADLIVTHRPNDYHADHRMTSLIVQDAAYLVRVPNVLPLTPRLEATPVIVYHQDEFNKPSPFVPEIIVDITDVVDRKMEALSLHESQVFEWIPFVEGYLQDVPKEKSERLRWLKTKWADPAVVEQFSPELKRKVAVQVSSKVQYIEAFERCEYGARLTHDNAKILFPFGIVNF